MGDAADVLSLLVCAITVRQASHMLLVCEVLKVCALVLGFAMPLWQPLGGIQWHALVTICNQRVPINYAFQTRL